MNKWTEWDDFSHKDNAVAPRATFFPGVFQVHLERKLISSYNMYQEKQRRERNNSASRKGSSHQNFVEDEMRESVQTQLEKFEAQKQSRANNTGTNSTPAAGMFENDTEGTSDGDEDPNFNAEEIAFKVRLQCHKDRKKMVRKLVKSGQVHASEPSPEKPRDGTQLPPRYIHNMGDRSSNM